MKFLNFYNLNTNYLFAKINIFSFFENINRTSRADYVVSMQDVLRMRVQSAGVTETQFTISGALFRYESNIFLSY
jgi:hypothetical protein